MTSLPYTKLPEDEDDGTEDKYEVPGTPILLRSLDAPGADNSSIDRRGDKVLADSHCKYRLIYSLCVPSWGITSLY